MTVGTPSHQDIQRIACCKSCDVIFLIVDGGHSSLSFCSHLSMKCISVNQLQKSSSDMSVLRHCSLPLSVEKILHLLCQYSHWISILLFVYPTVVCAWLKVCPWQEVTCTLYRLVLSHADRNVPLSLWSHLTNTQKACYVMLCILLCI